MPINYDEIDDLSDIPPESFYTRRKLLDDMSMRTTGMPYHDDEEDDERDDG